MTMFSLFLIVLELEGNKLQYMLSKYLSRCSSMEGNKLVPQTWLNEINDNYWKCPGYWFKLICYFLLYILWKKVEKSQVNREITKIVAYINKKQQPPPNRWGDIWKTGMH